MGLLESVEMQELDSVLVFKSAEWLCKNVGCLRCRWNVTNVDVSRVEDMTDVMMTRVNVFCPGVIDVVFDVL